jgi:transposase, IS6 family
MMQERGAEVEPSTIMRWVHHYAPELEKRVQWYQGYRATSCRVDETYVKVSGRWKYQFRAVDKHVRLIDFMLSDRRNTRATYRFLGKALTTMRHWPPSSVTTDQLGSYPRATMCLQREGKLSDDTKHRTCKYLNNIIEADHGARKRVIRPTRGFQTMKTAAATIKGFEVMRMIRRGQCITCKPHVSDEVRFVNKRSISLRLPSKHHQSKAELRLSRLMRLCRGFRVIAHKPRIEAI